MLAGTALHAWCLFTLEFDGPNSGKHLDSILALAVACTWHAGRPQGIHSASFCNRRWHVPRPKQSIFRHGMAASSIICVASTIATGCLPAAACPAVKVGIGFMPAELSNLDGQLCGSNVEVEQQISFLELTAPRTLHCAVLVEQTAILTRSLAGLGLLLRACRLELRLAAVCSSVLSRNGNKTVPAMRR